MDLIEMQNRLGSIVKEQRDLNDKNKEKAFSSEDRSSYDKMDAEYDRLADSVTRFKKQEEREASIALSEYGKKAEIAEKKEFSANAQVRALVFAASGVPSHMLPAEIREAQASLTPADGGILVPTILANEIDKALLSYGGIRSVARILQTSTASPFDMPTINDTASSSTTIASGKVAGAAKVAENVAAPGASKIVIGKKTFGGYLYSTGVLDIPRQLVRDSNFDIIPLLVEMLVERLMRATATKYGSGSGSGEPEGAITGASAGTTAAATALSLDNILDLIHSVDPAYRSSPSFNLAFNDATLKAARKIKDGDGNYIWQMGDIRTGAPGTLFNVQYIVDQCMPNIEANGVSMLAGDFSKYMIREVGPGLLRSSVEHNFAEDQTSIVYQKTFDAKVINSAAIKKLTHASS
jgi:HK97 family phage major capsid protein